MEKIAGRVISTILKHDTKVTSYKIALLRSINDVVMSFPDITSSGRDVAIPLRILAKYWFAYYWPFFDDGEFILQGPRSFRYGRYNNDMSFRGSLEIFRNEWSKSVRLSNNPSEGFFIINELSIARKRNTYPLQLLNLYNDAIKKISHTINMPIRHAGVGQWAVFERPKKYANLRYRCIGVPGTRNTDTCVVVSKDLWNGFIDMSLYIEALCIHEWSIFTENKNLGTIYERGYIYRLLTERPDNRRPLTWERNQIDILLMEDKVFICPWTEKTIKNNISYDLDHLIPVSVYPINDLWNLVPSDPYFNSHSKRNRIPNPEKLDRAQPHLGLAYTNYLTLPSTAQAIQEDAKNRFANILPETLSFPDALSASVVNYIKQVADARNIARF